MIEIRTYGILRARHLAFFSAGLGMFLDTREIVGLELDVLLHFLLVNYNKRQCPKLSDDKKYSLMSD